MRRIAMFAAAAVLLFMLPALSPAPGAPLRAEVWVLDTDGQPTLSITDGDLIRLQLRLAEPATAQTQADFYLDGRTLAAGCALRRGQTTCLTDPFRAQGWRWDARGEPQPLRRVVARAGEARLAESGPLQVAARPVVLVHGFNSNWRTWTTYLGADGYLAAHGLMGFAVGDGQAAGVMNTGSLLDPTVRTSTIAENAQQLAMYVNAVRQATGAQQVDLVAHSMGGLISRYYIDRVMADGDVAQLITLGTPNAGTDCANLAASLGMLHPATMEIRPSYVNGIFNRQVTRLRGVVYHAVAGNAIDQSAGSPCTETPTDMIVSLNSAAALPVTMLQTGFLHHELTNSREVYEQVVQPLLTTPAGQFQAAPDPVLAAAGGQALQFARVFTGTVPVGGSSDHSIQIEPGIGVASFALFDPSRSLTVSVVGASGASITLDTSVNGLVVVDDPDSLVHLGYGFNNPLPGPWVVTLHATERTPAEGAPYAVTAHLVGGATLAAQADPLLPRVNQAVSLSAGLSQAEASLPIDQAQALIRGPGGQVELVPLALAGDQASANWQPGAPGVYGIDILVTGQTPEGALVERSVFLAVEAQPPPNLLPTFALLAVLGVVCLGGVGLALAVVLWVRVRGRRRPI